MSSTGSSAASRREFVRGSVVTVATVCGLLSAGACSRGAHGRPTVWPEPALFDALGPESVLAIGAAWRAQHPRERSLAELEEALWQRLPRGLADLAPAEVNSLALSSAIARAIADDFETERLVLVDGWILAVTEARQCALYHVTNT